MSNIENKIEYICSKLDNLSAEIKNNNNNLFAFMKKTEMSLKINEQQLNGIKTDLQIYANKLAEVEKSQTFVNSQYKSQSKRHDTILTDHAKLQTNLACLSDEVSKLKKDLKNEKIDLAKEAQYRQNDKLEISGIPIKKGGGGGL